MKKYYLRFWHFSQKRHLHFHIDLEASKNVLKKNNNVPYFVNMYFISALADEVPPVVYCV